MKQIKDNNKIITSVYYQVQISLSVTLSCSDYSKYQQRFNLAMKGELPEGELVYGYKQAVEHVKEYYAKEDNYTKNRTKETLKIIKIITLTETITIFNKNSALKKL